MQDLSPELTGATDTARLLAYVADLELEVDRLRRQGRFVEKQAKQTLTRILRHCAEPTPDARSAALADIEAAARELHEVIRDLHDSPGYHPAHDQVVEIAVRPLAEKVFRWQQRLTGAAAVALRLDLKDDHVEWFPARLRHILDNLFAHVLRHRDPAAGEPWVVLGLRASGDGYELRVTDNGVSAPTGDDRRVLELFYRAAPAREAGFGAGLAVVKLLVEQSGGTLAATPGAGRGTAFVLTLPRYDLLDYLE